MKPCPICSRLIPNRYAVCVGCDPETPRRGFFGVSITRTLSPDEAQDAQLEIDEALKARSQHLLDAAERMWRQPSPDEPTVLPFKKPGEET